MQAFHNDTEIKNKYISRVKSHRELDNLIQGQGWENGKGCAVGCTLEKYDHAQYEVELGIPEWLARVEDTIFEGLPKEKAMLWPEQFLSAIKPGVDLEVIKKPFIIFILESCLESLDKTQFDADEFPDVQKAIDGSKAALVEMIRCHKENLDLSVAAWAAEATEAAEAAEAACAAARAAEAAEAAWAAAWAAARAAEATEAAEAAEAAAYEKFADELLRLIREV